MAKFRKKPVVIDAVKFTGENSDELIAFDPTIKAEEDVRGKYLMVTTLESDAARHTVHVASPGDWIIRGVKGEFYPCKPDVFDAIYELAEKNENLTHHAGIGWAVKQMHNSKKVRRVGWNGKGMYIAIVPGDSWGIGGSAPAFDNWGPGDMEPFVAIKNAQGKIIPWNASQGDLLAVDWEIAE